MTTQTQTKTIRSGMPYVMAGLFALGSAFAGGLGTVPSYIAAFGAAIIAYGAGKVLFPDRTVEVELKPQSGDAQTDALIAEARAQLAEIRRANDAIAEPQLSAQIDDIENTCRTLLDRLEERPALADSLRTFLRYYLPATLRLLSARAGLEREVETGGAGQIAAKIRDAMAQVQSALHKQLDAVNEYRFIDLESEMDALADMLRSDGLVPDEQTSPEQPSKQAASDDDPFAALFSGGQKGTK